MSKEIFANSDNASFKAVAVEKDGYKRKFRHDDETHDDTAEFGLSLYKWMFQWLLPNNTYATHEHIIRAAIYKQGKSPSDYTSISLLPFFKDCTTLERAAINPEPFYMDFDCAEAFMYPSMSEPIYEHKERIITKHETVIVIEGIKRTIVVTYCTHRLYEHYEQTQFNLMRIVDMSIDGIAFKEVDFLTEETKDDLLTTFDVNSSQSNDAADSVAQAYDLYKTLGSFQKFDINDYLLITGCPTTEEQEAINTAEQHTQVKAQAKAA